MDGQDVAVDAEADDDARGDRGDEGVMTELLALVHVGDVTLNQRQAGTLDGVVQSHRRMRERPGIEHRADRLPGFDRRSRFLDPVDQLALVIRLLEVDVKAQRGRRVGAQLLDISQRSRPVHLRLPGAQKIQIRPIQNEYGRHEALPPSTSLASPRTGWGSGLPETT